MSKEPYKIEGNKRKLLDLLWDLPYNRDPEHDIPDNQANGIIITMHTAVRENRVDEFIDVIENNPAADYDEIMEILFGEREVEYVDEIDEDDEDFAD